MNNNEGYSIREDEASNLDIYNYEGDLGSFNETCGGRQDPTKLKVYFNKDKEDKHDKQIWLGVGAYDLHKKNWCLKKYQ